MDRCKWRKVIKEARWSGWVWVGECFFWYRPTRVVPDQRPLNSRRYCCCCCVGCIYFIATHIHFSVSFDMAIIYLNLILRLTLTKYLVTLTKKYSYDSRNHVRWRSTQHLNNIHTLQVQCSSLHAALHQLTAYLALCVVCCGCIACTICTTLCISVWYIL